ncbi:MAG: hypothetical protein QXT19_03705 [Candidatus Woesearchaeota archaeon]
MYYIVELGWGKKTKTGYYMHCQAGVSLIKNDEYCVHGLNYFQKGKNRWLMHSDTVWKRLDYSSLLKGVLRKNGKVRLCHRSLDKIVTATVLSVSPVSLPAGFTFPQGR